MKNKSSLKSYTIVFLVVLFFLLIPVSITITNQAIEQKTQYNNRYYEEQLEAASSINNTIDSKFIDLVDVTFLIQNDILILEAIKGYMPNESPISQPIDLFNRKKCIARINSYMSHSLVNEIIVISKGKDIVITNGGWFKKDEYIKTYYPDYRGGFKDLGEMSLSPINILHINNDKKDESFNYKDSIWIACDTHGNYPINVVFRINRDTIAKYISNVSNIPFAKQIVTLEDMTLYGENREGEIFDFDYTSSLTNVNYKYKFLEPNVSVVTGPILFNFLIGLIFCVLVSLAISILFAPPIYRIYYKVVNNSRTSNIIQGTKIKISKNPVKKLENYIDDIEITKNELSHKITKYQSMIENDDVLLNILLAKNAEDYSDEIVDLRPWLNEDRYYSVILINNKAESVGVDNNIIDDVIKIMEHLPKEKDFTYYITSILSCDCAIILSYNSFDSETLIQIEEYFVNELKKIFVSLGPIEQGILGIQKSYNKARNHLQQYQFNTANIVGGYFFPISLELQLICNLKLANLDQSKQILETLLYENQLLDLTKAQSHKLYVALFDIFRRYAKEINYDISIYEKEFLRALNEDTGKINNIINTLCEDLAKYNGKKEDEEIDQLANQIRNYIIENFRDPNICINSIAEEFDISRTTLNNISKEIAEISLVDFINKLRINEVINLMETDRYTIHEISLMVGFNSYNTFKRAFVKHIGVLPSEYKNLFN